MLNITFDHSKSKLQESFGLNSDDITMIKDIIIFEIMNTHYQASLLYDDINDVPHNLKSVSSIIENCLKRCTSVKMAAYLLYTLEESKSAIYEALDFLNKHSLEDVKNSKMSGNDLLKMLKNVSKLLAMKRTMEDIIQASGSFEEYRKIKGRNNSDEIDELINKALNNKDEE